MFYKEDPALKAALSSPDFSSAEKELFKFLLDMQGGFKSCLFGAIGRADRQNRERLRKGFPELVAAYEGWTEGDLHARTQQLCSIVRVQEIIIDEENNVKSIGDMTQEDPDRRPAWKRNEEEE